MGLAAGSAKIETTADQFRLILFNRTCQREHRRGYISSVECIKQSESDTHTKEADGVVIYV